MKKKKIRPAQFTDLDIIWAIRDIPSSILCIKLKSIMYTFVALIGNSTNEWYYQSLENLSEKIGLSSRRLSKPFHALEELGFISIQRPKNYTKGDSNEYKLNYELIMDTAVQFRGQSLG